MTGDELRAGLVAIRFQIDGLIAGVDEAEAREAARLEAVRLEAERAAAAGACSHPENEREDISTMGRARRFRCRVCGVTLSD